MVETKQIVVDYFELRKVICEIMSSGISSREERESFRDHKLDDVTLGLLKILQNK